MSIIALHRIAARLRFLLNLKSLGGAARGEHGRSAAARHVVAWTQSGME